MPGGTTTGSRPGTGAAPRTASRLGTASSLHGGSTSGGVNGGGELALARKTIDGSALPSALTRLLAQATLSLDDVSDGAATGSGKLFFLSCFGSR